MDIKMNIKTIKNFFMGMKETTQKRIDGLDEIFEANFKNGITYGINQTCLDILKQIDDYEKSDKPLTEEILEELGFIKSIYNRSYTEYTKGVLKLYRYKNEKDFYIDFTHLQISTTNELQIIYNIFNKEEK